MSAAVFYAAAKRGHKTIPILGPYTTQAEATAQVDEAMRLVTTYYPTTWPDAYGVVTATPKAGDFLPPSGVLNHRASAEALIGVLGGAQ